MPAPDMQTFVAELERRGWLRRVSVEVDPELEITEITDRVTKAGGPALLFENVKGSDIPVLINTYGTKERMCLVLGAESFEQVAERVRTLIKPEMPATLMQKIKKLPELAQLGSLPPKIVKRGICQEVVHTDDADLFTLPALKCWPQDGGRYITLGAVFTKDPETDDRNIGLYRVQLFEPKLAAMHWHMHHDGARHYRKYKARGERMPLAIALGGPPVIPYAASAPLPPDVDEALFAGFLQGSGIELVPCVTQPRIEVPAMAEIVIEGYVDPDEELILEGPFGDHTGFYSLADYYPRFHVTAITHRRKPIFPAIIVGKPPQEDYWLGKATERIFLPLLQMLIPDISDYDLPTFGCFHNCAFVKIKKEYPYHARQVMSAIWGAGQMAFTKIIVVVDEHVDVHNQDEVLFQLCSNVDPKRDIMFVDGPLDILDHAAPVCGAGSKMGIDATRKIPGEGQIRDWPDEIEMSAEIKEVVTRRWNEYAL
ncbi:MAG TPA: menaquinone biosynthesis decarboxylase [Phycisphaerae bacterium]|nr:menaquinone biosynthesis decarboxylase [Phycisphaerae bacterium]